MLPWAQEALRGRVLEEGGEEALEAYLAPTKADLCYSPGGRVAEVAGVCVCLLGGRLCRNPPHRLLSGKCLRMERSRLMKLRGACVS